ncbi:MAE_28990/MAE_18760 family HEPN-like nuclease [Aeromonas veronii]|uniref:MAE_28990/MAE_18760 family HEPN-like nuclease n=1 Tax=Aeromonas veronii TaxID=654 RepID=UPI003B9E6492
MSTGSFNDTLNNEFDVLLDIMYKSKTIHLRYKMQEDHKVFLLRQAVLVIYSSWEGFVKKAIAIYLQKLNNEKLQYDQLHDNYIAYQTDQLVAFKKPKTDFDAVKKITKDIFSCYRRDVVFSTNINTESNANLKVVNGILNKLNLRQLSVSHESPLNKLLRFRNSVAHGDEGIPISQSDIDFFTVHVQTAASDLIMTILDGYSEKVFLT